MNSNRFNLTIVFFSIAIALTSFLFIWAVEQENKIVTSISLAAIWILEVIFLIRYVNITNRNLLLFLQSFQFKDASLSFTKSKNLPFKKIYDEFNRIIDQFNQMKTEKEIEHQYFEHIIKHVDTGLMAWDRGGKIHLINQAAKKLLNLPYISNLKGLENILDELPDTLKEIKPGRQRLIKVLKRDELVSLYLRVSEFTIAGEQIRLASFQNINPELEESKSEAWQKLIRVMTHEIVNSVGPIKLLSSTLLKTVNGLSISKKRAVKQLTVDKIGFTMEDYNNICSGLQAINNRSQGLSKFVEDYKTITDLPRPNFDLLNVAGLIDDMLTLLKDHLIARGIKINTSISPPDLKILMDRKLIEQVLINIIKNAVHALQDHSNPLISIISKLDYDRAVIIVEDNGCGIPFNTMDYIFMPFFTTKQGGSGIGLTLSRQIMKLHDGTINLISKEGEGTRVVLTF